MNAMTANARQRLRAFYACLLPFSLSEANFYLEHLESLSIFFRLISSEDDQSYSKLLYEESQVNTLRVTQTLEQILGKERVRRIVLCSNEFHETPWNRPGRELPDFQDGKLIFSLSDGRLFSHELREYVLKLNAQKKYRTVVSAREVNDLRTACHTHILNGLYSHLRGTLTNGLEDEVGWGLSEAIETLVLAALVGDEELRTRYEAILALYTSCAPFAEDPDTPGLWYVFVR